MVSIGNSVAIFLYAINTVFSKKQVEAIHIKRNCLFLSAFAKASADSAEALTKAGLHSELPR